MVIQPLCAAFFVADYFAPNTLARGVTRSGIASGLVRFLHEVSSLQIILHRIPSLSSQLALDITARAIGAGVIAVRRLLLSPSCLLCRLDGDPILPQGRGVIET